MASLRNGHQCSSIAALVCGVVVLGLACVSAQQGEAPRSPSPAVTALPATMTDVVTGLEFPWGLAFLPDGRMLVTERAGRLRVVTRERQAG